MPTRAEVHSRVTGEVQHRTIRAAIQQREDLGEEAAVDLDSLAARQFDVSVSSDTVCQRWYGTERLSHEEDAIRLERFASREGIPLLWSHNREGAGSAPGATSLGRLTAPRLEDGVLRCTMTLSRAESARDLLIKVREGTITDLSVGYRIIEFSEREDPDGWKIELTATEWEPQEVSLCAIGLDQTIGVARNDEPETPIMAPSINLPSIMPQSAEEELRGRIQELQDQLVDLQPAPADGQRTALAERQRVSRIHAMCAHHGASNEQRDQWINDGTSEGAAMEALLNAAGARQHKPAVHPVDLPDGRGERKYRISAAISHLLGMRNADTELAAEISQECERHGGQLTADRSILIPWTALVRGQRTLAAGGTGGGTAAGGSFIATDTLVDQMIEALRSETIAMNMGITPLVGLTGNVSIPKLTGTSTAYWLSNDQSAITESNLTTGAVELQAKNVAALSKITRQMMVQTAGVMDELVRQDLMATIGEAIDTAVFHGKGSGGEPRGITNTSGIGSKSGGANGGAFAIGDPIDLKTLVRKGKARGPLAIATNATVTGAMSQARAGANSGPFLWVDNMDTGAVDMQPGRFRGMRVWESEIISDEGTKGTGTGLSTLIVGVFRNVVLGTWGPGIEVAIGTDADDFSKAIRSVRAITTVDVGIRHAQAFAARTDITS